MQWGVAYEALCIVSEALKVIGDTKLAAAVSNHAARMYTPDYSRLFDHSGVRGPPPLDVRVLQAIVRSENSVLALCCPGRLRLEDAERLKALFSEFVGSSLNPAPGSVMVIGDDVTLGVDGDAELVDHGVQRLDMDTQ